ncbi:hypothetical protein SEPCBS57363_003180 [Sporothrix epigloea]|uniref:DUF4484 domain-containing protein n=1 Tax=Sporothrix epigloea TaxID=1892477 RepID=A0ABP0DK20_9PEZI
MSYHSTAQPTTPRREPAMTAPTAPTASTGLLPDRPPIAALFLIEFDVKAGYTIVWKQAVPGLDLAGAVEYKSLPSGLHTVSEDLVYFVHGELNSNDNENGDGGVGSSSPGTSDTGINGYAGLSAFVNLSTDDTSARNARMIAVGVLVPRSYGRLGRAWRHAQALLCMARQLAAHGDEVQLLVAYWRENSSSRSDIPGAATSVDTSDGTIDRPLVQTADAPSASPAYSKPPPMGYRPYPSSFGSLAGHARNRSASDGTALLLPPGHHLSPYHPAWSLTTLLDNFGPLIFPIYRAALLRKRILISAHAPVREVNNFVYNISVLANIPISALDLLEPSAVSFQRIRPLFTIGVNDISFLLDDLAASKRAAREAEAAAYEDSQPRPPNASSHQYNGPGWIACTTDSILAVKAELWDVLITMPPAHQTATLSGTARDKKTWPTVVMANGVPLRATQRDLRRFKALKAGLKRLVGRACCTQDDESGPREHLAGGSSDAGAGSKLFLQDDAQLVEASESVVEPVTWTALAYNGFMWWASAGEQRRSEETDETIHDAQLLADIVPPRSPHPSTDAFVGASSSNLLDSVTSLSAPQEILSASSEDEDENEDRVRLELAIITYFHRLTTQTLSVLSDAVESGEDDGDDAYYDDGDEGEDADDLYHFYDDDGTDAETNAHGADSEGISGRSGRATHGDGLTGARRSGMAPASAADAEASSSTAALLLRRRCGRRGPTSESSSRSWRHLQQHSSAGRSAIDRGDSTLCINSDAVSRMGLDVWSLADAGFVRDIAQQYFGRRSVYVESKGVEVCGLKVC